MRLRYILQSFFILAFIYAPAQTLKRNAVYSNGGFSSSASVSLQSNIGELMVETWNDPQNYVSQGFVQPDQSLITLVNNKAIVESEAHAYPNPVVSALIVELSGVSFSGLNVVVFDLVGKEQQVFLTEIYSNDQKCKFELDLKMLRSGSYLVRIVSSNKEFSKTLKINKL